MIKSLKKAVLSVGALIGAVALLSLSPAAKVDVSARGPEVAMGVDVSKYQ